MLDCLFIFISMASYIAWLVSILYYLFLLHLSLCIHSAVVFDALICLARLLFIVYELLVTDG